MKLNTIGNEIDVIEMQQSNNQSRKLNKLRLTKKPNFFSSIFFFFFLCYSFGRDI